MKGKVAFIDRSDALLVEELAAMGYECIDAYLEPLEELRPLLPQLTGIVIRSRFTLDDSFLKQCINLRFIARMGIGLEHIDLDYAASRDIIVLNSPEGSRDTVAEHTMGLMLGMLHFLQRSNLQIRAGKWDRKQNEGLELRHRTVGIIGYGNIGSAVGQRLRCFGCKVMAYDKFKTGFGDEWVEEVSLEYLQQQADIITLHIPYEDYNHHFVNKAFLSAFKKPIFLINTARGLVLNTEDLVSALKNGTVLGAALDVLEYEEQAFNVLDVDNLPAPFQYLRQSENVILTPHTAGISEEVMEAHAAVLAEKIRKL